MTDEPMEPRTPDQERALSALGALAVAPAAPEFRERLKLEFASGQIVSRLPLGAVVSGRIVPRESGRRRAFWLVPAAIAAGLAIVVALNRGPEWRVVSATGTGVAVIGTLPVPMGHVEELGQRLRPGVRLRIPDGATLEVASGRNLAIEVTPGTDVVLPEAPGRWFGRRIAGEIERGEVRITTGERFKGAVLTFVTPEARVEVRGTTLAVIREPIGTCICVFEGRVEVGEIGGPMVPVEHGMRRFVFNDGRAPELAPIRETEVTPLGRLREHQHELMR